MGAGGPVTNDLRYVGPEPVAGGTILGIHNLAIVLPQLVVSRWIPFFFVLRTNEGLRLLLCCAVDCGAGVDYLPFGGYGACDGSTAGVLG